MTLAPAARAPVSSPDGIAAPPSRIAPNADRPAPASSIRRSCAGTRAGADPVQAGPGGGQQRVRAELDALGLAGGAGGGYHDRRAVRQVYPGPRRGRARAVGAPSFCTVERFYRGWSESVQQIGDPVRRQARVEREDRGAAAVQRRRQRVKQAAGPGGGREQEGVQGGSGHQRKVNGRKLQRNGRGRRDRVAAAGLRQVPAPAVTGGVLDQVAGLLDGMRAFAIPMRTRFRGITVREGALIEGPAGWGEFSPFAEYGPRECARWLCCALEAALTGWPA